MTTLYLQCDDCFEVFEDQVVDIAHNHMCIDDEPANEHTRYTIVTEDQAFNG